MPKILPGNERGEPTASYKLNEPVELQAFRKITHHFKGIYRICLKFMKKIRKFTTCNLVGLGNTKILNDYAQKSPRTLLPGDCGQLPKVWFWAGSLEIWILVCTNYMLHLPLHWQLELAILFVFYQRKGTCNEDFMYFDISMVWVFEDIFGLGICGTH